MYPFITIQLSISNFHIQQVAAKNTPTLQSFISYLAIFCHFPPGGSARCAKVAKDPYAVLGVEPGSSVEEIRAAYRQRARSEHPDISDAPDAQAREGGAGGATTSLPWKMVIFHS